MNTYKIVFKLPCEKMFSFNIDVLTDDFDPTKEIGKRPSRYMLDYYLLYVPELQGYCGDEISNGTVVNVYKKNNDGVKSPVIKSASDEHETDLPMGMAVETECIKDTIKNKYWKNGNIIKTRGNGYAIISNNIAFCENGSLANDILDDNLDVIRPMDVQTDSNDVTEVWLNVSKTPFNPYLADDIHKHCLRIWTRCINMTREEIEKRLNLPKGSLVVTD